MDTARFILFALVTGIATVAVHVYLYRRLFAATSEHRAWRRVGMGVMTVLGTLLVLSWAVTRFLPMDSTFAVATAVWTWMGMAIYLLLALGVLATVRMVAARMQRSRGEPAVVELRGGAQVAGTRASVSHAHAVGGSAQAGGTLAATGTESVSVTPEALATSGHGAAATGTESVSVTQEAMAPGGHGAAATHAEAAPVAMATGADGATSAAPVDVERRRFLARATAGGAVLAAGGVTGFGMWSAFHPPVVNEVAVKLPGLPKALDGFSIVHLSDIHVGPVIRRRFMDELVRRCNALRPDLVCITGDLVDGHVASLAPAVSALSELKSRHGTYFVTGNHEYYWSDAAWAEALEQMDVHVLRNRHVRIGDTAASFDLVGVDDWSAGKMGFSQGYDLAAATTGRDSERASVLLAHQPSNWKVAAREGMGLQLSGHTHGGQFFPFTLAVSAIWEHDAGLFHEGDRHLYVSRGTGFWGPPLRVGAPPEIVRVTLLA
ncbi:serine/threonine protein phosphatase [Myxococcus xanthus]|uniref:Serine/threonine protein phosphatase n=1 Tax=Myxococcus xanthus TaxID=34 RepID=A0AAE6FWD8_MYXXA|nr:metallophosphoesterase [Myxococcus xanthus]QDE66334.1 serine/threonine protein phosphatase [Myxococcus xanthus]QDE73607.1 serine/threonine protein phosphatase [Myxococcus xanthus]